MHKSTWSPSAPRASHGDGSYFWNANRKLWTYVREGPRDPATGKRRQIRVTCAHPKALRTRIDPTRIPPVVKTRLQAKMTAKIAELERTGWMPSNASPVLSDWLDRWLETIKKPQLKPKTYANYVGPCNASIKPTLGAMRLKDIQPADIRRMLNWITADQPTPDGRIRKARSAATADNAFTILDLALADAVREGLLASNPCERTRRISAEGRETIPFTPAEARRILELEPDPMLHLMWGLLLALGMRQGELLAILAPSLVLREVTDADGARRTTHCIVVMWELQRLKDPHWRPGLKHVDLGDGWWLLEVKSKAGNRILPLPRELDDELTAYMATHQAGTHGLLFHDQGRPIGADWQRDRWRDACTRAGLDYRKPHSARHFAATELDRANLPEGIRTDLMSHADIGVTEAVYTHRDVSRLLEGTQAVEDSLRSAVTPDDITPTPAEDVERRKRRFSSRRIRAWDGTAPMGEWDSIKAAAESLVKRGKCSPSGVMATLQNINKALRRQGTAYGWTWEYAD